jgi:catechol 2,3-dioxygenase-like lactoylglutathione lyase family enzyme
LVTQGHNQTSFRAGAVAVPEIEAVVETALYAADLEQIERFYTEVLGLSVIAEEPGRHVFFRVGTGSVLLAFNPKATLSGENHPAHGATGPGHFALGIRAETLDAWRSWLTEKGITIEKEVTWPSGGSSIYFRDPADNSVELVTPGLWGTAAGW